MKIQKSFRLEEEILDKLAKIASENNLSLTDTLKLVIQSYPNLNDINSKSSYSLTNKTLEVLTTQLAQKDEQISQLNMRLEQAQIITDQAQKLQAVATQERLALESTEQKEKRSLMSKLKDLFN